MTRLGYRISETAMPQRLASILSHQDYMTFIAEGGGGKIIGLVRASPKLRLRARTAP